MLPAIPASCVDVDKLRRNSIMTRSRSFLTLALVLALCPRGTAQEKLPPGAKLVRLEVTPQAIELKNPFDYRQVLVTGVLAGGEHIDVTRICQVTAPEKLVAVSERGQVRPRADGSGNIRFAIEGQGVTVPVKVSGQTAKHEVSFVRDVMPILSKVGCNAGTCHGAQAGKNGFQ